MSLDEAYQSKRFRSPEAEVEYELRQFEADDPLAAWDMPDVLDGDVDDRSIAW